jgi:hypothetical protein
MILAFSLLPSTFAQTGGAEAVFRNQLVDLHSKAVATLDRIEKAGPRGVPRQPTRDEIFALVRLLHRLEEEAATTNLQFMQRGQPSNKTLLMVQQAAKAIDGMLTALDNYVESEDRAFLGFARDNNALAWSVRKVM